MNLKKKFLLIVIFVFNVCFFTSCSTPPSKDIVAYNDQAGPNAEIFPAKITDEKSETLVKKTEKKIIVNIYNSSKQIKDTIFKRPKGIAFDKVGNLYIVDQDYNKVLKFSPKGDLLLEWGNSGSENEGFKEPKYITVDDKQDIIISDTWNGRVKVYDSEGKLLSIIKEALFGPKGVQVHQNKIYLADTGNHTIKVFSMDGKLEKSIGEPGKNKENLNEPTDLVFDDKDNLYIADTKNNRIAKFDKDGKFVLDWKVDGWNDPERGKECWMLFYKNKIYLSNLDNKSVDVFDTNGKKLTKLAENIDAPTGIAVYKDNIYFFEAGKYLLHKEKI